MSNERLRISDVATNDLFSIYEYIAEDNVAAAEKQLASIKESFELLAEFPRLGRAREELNTLEYQLRSFIEGNFLILYQLDSAEHVVIVRVLHGAMDVAQWLRAI